MQDKPIDVVIHDDTEVVFKEEDMPIQFTDRIDQRAESNSQEVEVTHHFITDNVYGAETELRNEFKSAEALGTSAGTATPRTPARTATPSSPTVSSEFRC